MALLVVSSAYAAEPKVAIAPIAVQAPADLERTFQEELPRALAAAGFSLTPPNEVDMRVSERPELLRCASGGCLAEEAAFLRVERLVLPRLEPATDKDGGLTLGLSLYDASQKKSICDAVARCTACTSDKLRATIQEAAVALRVGSLKPGTLEVSSDQRAELTIDDKPVGKTPWRGEVAPGDHLVIARAGGQRVERDVSVAPGRTAHVQIELQAQVPGVVHRPTRFRVAKWVLFAGGLALAAAGAGVWAIDGHGTCSLRPLQQACPQVYDTIGLGATGVGLGGALLLTSFIMMGLDKPVDAPAVTAEVRF
jgi:hypothetical protein